MLFYRYSHSLPSFSASFFFLTKQVYLLAATILW
ncbi:hypothetical protein CHY_2635 [Carboxydothermus hydrogenoformans Z-2901]|uniref:Uncharacterized protein n=1 Tax=Carboxydothermus hydrogenoformans (strain ATCC BAA-161 / DSM 6008 / Z-2901) TaxID=246194 RepID=Q3A8V7_CARHZ|nr:hypothetical protein CHY_2635 [Carboxydothermus hydrogenoformans Z-2901]